jgi:hypothetical protein
VLSHTATEHNPGSFTEFTQRVGINPHSPEAVTLHGEALWVYRQALAAEHNMTLDELHSSMGRQALETIISA